MNILILAMKGSTHMVHGGIIKCMANSRDLAFNVFNDQNSSNWKQNIIVRYISVSTNMAGMITQKFFALHSLNRLVFQKEFQMLLQT